MDQIVSDILFDFATKPRLASARGNAMLVAGSIRDACKYFELFQKTELADKCAVITSYDPQAAHVSREETGAGTATDRQFIYDTYGRLLAGVTAQAGQSRTKTYEDAAKARFIKEPARMKLLIVVDKLLTGFDAPPCSCLYLDKRMRDHGLFQAICRTNRLDGDDKPYGVIVDYQDLFPRVRDAIAVYTEELDGEAEEDTPPDIQVADRLARACENLESAREAYALLCAPVQPPKGDLDFIQYFCGNSENPAELEETSPSRAALYQAIAALVRAHANLTGDMAEAGYSEADRNAVEGEVDHAIKLRDLIRNAAGEHIDLKAYEADMRHLIDTYIQADPARPLSAFDEIPLLDLIVKSGIAEAVRERLSRATGDKDAIAETIENNVRATIIQESLSDPEYFEQMSALLDEVIAQHRAGALDYEAYLKEIEQIARRVAFRGADENWPDGINTPGQRALFNNLGQDADLAREIDQAVKAGRPDGYVGDPIRERRVKQILHGILGDTGEVERVFALIVQHEEFR
jgi:type I restriction enzyme, R subunit